MNIGEVKTSIYTLLNANKSTLVTDIEHQGIEREIKQIMKSILTPPVEYYSISIHCPDADETLIAISNTSTLRPVVLYQMELHVSDYAAPQPEDTNAFETMHQDFLKVVSRIVKLVRETQWIPTSTSSPKYRLQNPDNGIQVSDETAWFDGGKHPIIYAVIRFNLFNTCGDSGALY